MDASSRMRCLIAVKGYGGNAPSKRLHADGADRL